MNPNLDTWGLTAGIMFVLGMISFMLGSEGKPLLRALKLVAMWIGSVGFFLLCFVLWYIVFK